MSGWQPIETAPMDGRGVLVVDVTAERPEAGCAWFLFGKWSAVDPDGAPVFEPELYHAMVWDTPTHWMPLPPPPDVES
jgi:hypothetical protein